MNCFKTDTLIELHVPDFQKAYDFYKILGFSIHWMDESYMIVKSQNTIINFYGGTKDVSKHSYFKNFPSDTKKGYGVEIIIFQDNLEEVFNKVKTKTNVIQDIQKKPWGVLDFRIEDPFGYYLRISEKYNLVEDPKKLEKSNQVILDKKFKL